MRLGEEEAVSYLMRCAHAGDAIREVGHPGAVEAVLRAAVGLPEGDIEAYIAGQCEDGAIDRTLFARIIAANRAWATATGDKIVGNLTGWLALDANSRAQRLEEIEKRIDTLQLRRG